MGPNYSSSDAQQQNIHCVFILLRDTCSLLCGFWCNHVPHFKRKKKDLSGGATSSVSLRGALTDKVSVHASV